MLIVDRVELPSRILNNIITVDDQESVTITRYGLEVEEFRVVDSYIQRVDGIALRCGCGNCIVVQTGLVVGFTILCPFILVTLCRRFYNRIIHRGDNCQIEGYDTIAALCGFGSITIITGSRIRFSGYAPCIGLTCRICGQGVTLGTFLRNNGQLQYIDCIALTILTVYCIYIVAQHTIRRGRCFCIGLAINFPFVAAYLSSRMGGIIRKRIINRQI